MDTIRVVTFSNTGFKPNVQTYYLKKLVWYHLSDSWNKDFEVLQKNIYLNKSYRHEIDKIHKMKVKFYKSHYEDFTEGVWVFKYGNVDKDSIKHLNSEDGKFVQKWQAFLPADTPVYDVEWTRLSTLKAETILPFGCYVPKRCLKYLDHVKRLY